MLLAERFGKHHDSPHPNADALTHAMADWGNRLAGLLPQDKPYILKPRRYGSSVDNEKSLPPPRRRLIVTQFARLRTDLPREIKPPPSPSHHTLPDLESGWS